MSNQDSGNPAAKPPKGKTAARRKARSLAVQALYSWQIAGQPLHEIEAQFRTDNDFSEVDGAYFHEILHGVPRQKSELDSTFEPCLERPLAEIDPVELAILRLSTYELRNRIDVPYKVVINEGIELAKTFGATDGHKFVNGVLDKLAPRLRAAELRGGKRSLRRGPARRGWSGAGTGAGAKIGARRGGRTAAGALLDAGPAIRSGPRPARQGQRRPGHLRRAARRLRAYRPRFRRCPVGRMPALAGKRRVERPARRRGSLAPATGRRRRLRAGFHPAA
ncbi:transcription antitermination protein NusB [Pseudomonas aeruginosa VRFPA02]|nr:transcription antitermination protein NusB [Pseudomonas aeruginosa VRFPA02]